MTKNDTNKKKNSFSLSLLLYLFLLSFVFSSIFFSIFSIFLISPLSFLTYPISLSLSLSTVLLYFLFPLPLLLQPILPLKEYVIRFPFFFFPFYYTHTHSLSLFVSFIPSFSRSPIFSVSYHSSGNSDKKERERVICYRREAEEEERVSYACVENDFSFSSFTKH